MTFDEWLGKQGRPHGMECVGKERLQHIWDAAIEAAAVAAEEQDDDRSEAECRLLKIHLRELKSEFQRLSKIEFAASRVAQQTNAEMAYALHDDLIAALEGPNGQSLPARAGGEASE